ncbi:MAG: hypothetical protein Q8O95_01990 [bacterium]|nr:hypothetical protein [bacterium]
MKKIAVFSFALFLALSLTACTRTAGKYDQFAQCLTKKGITMYGSDECPHCMDQKALFEGSFDMVDYVNCLVEGGKCQKAGIEGYPTWVGPNNKRVVGTQSLSSLSEEFDCPLEVETAG